MNTNSNTAVVEAHHLTKQFKGPSGVLQILCEVNFSALQGEAIAIHGASGAGKSTLLGVLAGLDSPSAGRASLFGTDLAALDEDGRAKLRAGRVGFVFQSFQLLPGLTALENVMLPLELSGRGRKARRLAVEALKRVGLAGRMGHYSQQLSGGEQQRVAIARAFAPRPQVLFADEPTGNLDQATGHNVIQLLFNLRDDDRSTLILVTHDFELTAYCDRRYRLQSGRLDAY